MLKMCHQSLLFERPRQGFEPLIHVMNMIEHPIDRVGDGVGRVTGGAIGIKADAFGSVGAAAGGGVVFRFNNASGYADCCGSGRNRFDDNRIGADSCAVANLNRAEHLCARADDDIAS